MSVIHEPKRVTQPTTLVDTSGAHALLADLCRPFVRGEFQDDCQVVQPEDIPFPEDHLLVHHDHMTVVLERHHRAPVQVHVLEEHLTGNLYTRKIVLTPRGSEKRIEWGIVRMDFQYMPETVKQEILAKRSPLGAILIEHDVHRRIKPRYFLRLPEQTTLFKLFDGPKPNGPLYGRLGSIYCDDEPCIELLEIVLNAGPT